MSRAKGRDWPGRVAKRLEERAALTETGPVMEAAAGFLAVRPRSVAETRRRLRHLGYPQTLADEVVARLVEMRYLDDAVFARAWVESRDRARPRGEAALRRELTLRGVARDIIDEVLHERVGSDPDADPNRAAAGALLERRRNALEREPDLARRRHKAYALLARNGFDPETCRAALATFEAGGGEDEEPDRH